MLRKWVRRAERDRGVRPGPTTAERERMKDLEREIPICDTAPPRAGASPSPIHAKFSSTLKPRIPLRQKPLSDSTSPIRPHDLENAHFTSVRSMTLVRQGFVTFGLRFVCAEWPAVAL
jgi:hypothetical protein